MATVNTRWQSRDDLSSWLMGVLKTRLKSPWLTPRVWKCQLELLTNDLSSLMCHGYLQSMKSDKAALCPRDEVGCWHRMLVQAWSFPWKNTGLRSWGILISLSSRGATGCSRTSWRREQSRSAECSVSAPRCCCLLLPHHLPAQAPASLTTI